MNYFFFVSIISFSCLAFPQESSIEGELGYPSEILPALKVCAVEMTSLKETCVESKQAQIKYKIVVPPGRYQVYASLVAARGSRNTTFRAYFTEYAACGLKSDCLSHKVIEFDLKSNERKKQVNPQDWSVKR